MRDYLQNYGQYSVGSGVSFVLAASTVIFRISIKKTFARSFFSPKIGYAHIRVDSISIVWGKSRIDEGRVCL